MGLSQVYQNLVSDPNFQSDPDAQAVAKQLQAKAAPIYQSMVGDPSFKSDPDAQTVAHQLRASGLVVDATQGGLAPAPTVPVTTSRIPSTTQAAAPSLPAIVPPAGDIPNTPLYEDEKSHGGYAPAARETLPPNPTNATPTQMPGGTTEWFDKQGNPQPAPSTGNTTKVTFNDGAVGTYDQAGKRTSLDTSGVHPNVYDAKTGMQYWDEGAKAYLPARKVPNTGAVPIAARNSAADALSGQSYPEFFSQDVLPTVPGIVQGGVTAGAKKIGVPDYAAKVAGGAAGAIAGVGVFAPSVAANVAAGFDPGTPGQNGVPASWTSANHYITPLATTIDGLVRQFGDMANMPVVQPFLRGDPKQFARDLQTHPEAVGNLLGMAAIPSIFHDPTVVGPRASMMATAEGQFRQAARGANLAGDAARAENLTARANQLAQARQTLLTNYQQWKATAITENPKSWIPAVKALPADAAAAARRVATGAQSTADAMRRVAPGVRRTVVGPTPNVFEPNPNRVRAPAPTVPPIPPPPPPAPTPPLRLKRQTINLPPLPSMRVGEAAHATVPPADLGPLPQERAPAEIRTIPQSSNPVPPATAKAPVWREIAKDSYSAGDLHVSPQEGGGFEVYGRMNGKISGDHPTAEAAMQSVTPSQVAAATPQGAREAPQVTATASQTTPAVILQGMTRTAPWGGEVADPIAQQLLKSPEAKPLIDTIPPGSEPIGAGAAAVALRTPQGDVVRIGPAVERPDIPEVLQPTSVQRSGNLQSERLPFVEMAGITDADVTDMSNRLAAKGYKFSDPGTDNLGKTADGKLVVTDPGAVTKVSPGLSDLASTPINKPTNLAATLGDRDAIAERVRLGEPETTPTPTPAPTSTAPAIPIGPNQAPVAEAAHAGEVDPFEDNGITFRPPANAPALRGVPEFHGDVSEPVVIPKTTGKAEATAAVAKALGGPKLPSELSKASPRYSYGSRQFTLDFPDDVTKAHYIVGNPKTLSKADAGYMDFLRKQFPGKADEDIRATGSGVRESIKKTAAIRAKIEGPSPALKTKEGITLRDATAKTSLSHHLETAANAAADRVIEGNKGRLLSGVIDPADVRDIAIWGASRIVKGLMDLGNFGRAAIQQFGDWVKPHIASLWEAARDAANAFVNDESGHFDKDAMGQRIAKMFGKDTAHLDEPSANHEDTQNALQRGIGKAKFLTHGGPLRSTAALSENAAASLMSIGTRSETAGAFHEYALRNAFGVGKDKMSADKIDLLWRWFKHNRAVDFEQSKGQPTLFHPTGEPYKYNTKSVPKLSPAELAQVASDPEIQHAKAALLPILQFIEQSRLANSPDGQLRNIPTGDFMSLIPTKGGVEIPREGPAPPSGKTPSAGPSRFMKHAEGTADEYDLGIEKTLEASVREAVRQNALRQFYETVANERSATGQKLALVDVMKVKKADGTIVNADAGRKAFDGKSTIEYNGKTYRAQQLGGDPIYMKNSKGDTFKVRIAVPNGEIGPDGMPIKGGPGHIADDFDRMIDPKLNTGEGAHEFMGIAGSAATGFSLASPGDLVGHVSRLLSVAGNILASNGLNLGTTLAPALELAKRVVNVDASSTDFQNDVIESNHLGGGSIRPFQHAVDGLVSHFPILKQISAGTHGALFNLPAGKGLGATLRNGGFDTRLRVVMLRILREAEPDATDTRKREFLNQLGQYASVKDPLINELMRVNPYAATRLPLMGTELRQAAGDAGIKGTKQARVQMAARMATSAIISTITAHYILNYALSGHAPPQNADGHKLDVEMDSNRVGGSAALAAAKAAGWQTSGSMIYIPLRALNPAQSRVLSETGLGDTAEDLMAGKDASRMPSHVVRGLINTGLSTTTGPLAGLLSGNAPLGPQQRGVAPFIDRGNALYPTAPKAVHPANQPAVNAESSVANLNALTSGANNWILNKAGIATPAGLRAGDEAGGGDSTVSSQFAKAWNKWDRERRK